MHGTAALGRPPRTRPTRASRLPQDPDAIAYSLNRHPPFSTDDAKVTSATVSDWLKGHQLDPKYGTGAKTLDLVVLDAPKLLHDLYLDLSAARLEYWKTTHSVELTEWILTNTPEQLSEVGELLKTILSPKAN